MLPDGTNINRLHPRLKKGKKLWPPGGVGGPPDVTDFFLHRKIYLQVRYNKKMPKSFFWTNLLHDKLSPPFLINFFFWKAIKNALFVACDMATDVLVVMLLHFFHKLLSDFFSVYLILVFSLIFLDHCLFAASVRE